MKKTISALLFSLVLAVGIFAQSEQPIPHEFGTLTGTVTATDSPTTYLLSQAYVRIRIMDLVSFDRYDIPLNEFGQYSIRLPLYRSYIVQPYAVTRGMLQFPRTYFQYSGSDYVELDESDYRDFRIRLQTY